jgi:hypothetical protein
MELTNRVRVLTALLVVLTMGLPKVSAGDPAVRLFLDDPSLSTDLTPAAQEKLSATFGATLLYGRSVRVNPRIFDLGMPGDRIELNLFPGVSFEAVCLKSSKTEPSLVGVQRWIGRVVGNEATSAVTITMGGIGVEGYVIVGDREFTIRATDRDGSTSIIELARKRKRDR